MKETEVKSLLSLLPSLVDQISEEERDDLQGKVENLQQQWGRLANQLDRRLSLTRTYVKFHTLAVDLASELDSLEEDLRRKDSKADDGRSLGERWFSAKQLLMQLQHAGKNFADDADRVSYLLF